MNNVEVSGSVPTTLWKAAEPPPPHPPAVMTWSNLILRLYAAGYRDLMQGDLSARGAFLHVGDSRVRLSAASL